jgi:hypothetical protein
MKTLTNTISIVVVAALCMLVQLAGAVTFTQPVMMDTAEGVSIDTTGTNIAIGNTANGGVSGTAVGHTANGYNEGVAVGYQANGEASGAAVGHLANGRYYGAAVGHVANGFNYGAAVGDGANGQAGGAAVGRQANGYCNGAAVGHTANGHCGGAALGYSANGYNYGISLGRGANAGAGSSSNPRIAVGYLVNNDVNNSCRIRGTLYIDGSGAADANIKYRQTFDTGAWSTKTFVIDHPLDPKNKLLRHACLESPEVLNVYRGTAVVDNKGEAVIALPEYFEALNKNPHYVFAPIGAAMPNLHVKQKMRNNTFVIAGGASDGEVCWQVTAERNDRAVRENPMVVEEKKAIQGLVYRR